MKYASILLASALLAPAAAAQTPAQKCSLYNQEFNVYFQYESIEINKFGRAVIDQALSNITDAPSTCKVENITIDSHTDTSGSEMRNMYLSAAIAQNFVDLLLSLERFAVE